MATTFKIKNGDIVMSNVSGRPTLITASEKVKQDIVEFFTIQILPSGFGAGLEQLIGVVPLGDAIFVSMADKMITEGLDAFRSLQRSDLNITRSAEERIIGATSIHVSQDPTDPTKYRFRANIITESGLPIPVDIPSAS